MEKAAGEEGEKDMITTSMNVHDPPCKWLQEGFRAMLKCLGFEICSADHNQPSPSAASASHQISVSSSSSSSSYLSSYSGDNGEDRKCHQQLPIPADNDPPPSTTDPPPLISSLSNRPRRPGLGNSGDPQTNDTSS